MRKIDIERRSHRTTGHFWGAMFAISMPTGLYAAQFDSAAGERMCLWAGLCLGLAIFFWFKGSK